MAAQPLQHGVGDAADADLQRRPVGDPLDDVGGDPAVALVGRGRRDLDQRPVRLAVAEQLARVDLVEPEGARHPRVDLEEERHLADQRRHVVGVRPEREVARAVRRARGGEHDRLPRGELQQPRHLAEVVRDELAAALPVGLAGRVREEVGDVPQPVAVGPVEVRPLLQRVHLVHPHAAQALVLALEHVEQPDRLPVGQRQDHVRAGPDVREDVLGPAGDGQRSRHGAQDGARGASRAPTWRRSVDEGQRRWVGERGFRPRCLPQAGRYRWLTLSRR